MFDVSEDLAGEIRRVTRGGFSDDEIWVKETTGCTGQRRREIVTNSNRTLAEIGPGGRLHTGGYSQSRFPGDDVRKDKDSAGMDAVSAEILGDNLKRQIAERERNKLRALLDGAPADPQRPRKTIPPARSAVS